MNRSTLTRRTKNKKARRIARGGVRGQHTVGRGMKGQKSRAGSKKRPEWRDIIKKLPKLRGRGKNSNKSIQSPYIPVNVATLEAAFDNGAEVNPTTLIAQGLVQHRGKKMPKVKILSRGDLTKKLTVSKVAVSALAAEKITKAGGSVIAQ